VIENLRNVVEDDEKKIFELWGRVNNLEIVVKRKYESMTKVLEETKKLGIIFKGIVAKSEEIYQSYKKALAMFGAEPLPLPPHTKGVEGVLRLFEWLLGEFEELQEIAETAEDNAAAVSCEGLIALLRHAGCADMEKLAQ
jgi:laccase